MNAVTRAADRIAQVLALGGALAILAMLVHVCFDVALRNLGGTPVPGTNEIASRYYMVPIAFLPLAWVERRRGMISVEVLDMVLKGPWPRISNILVALLSLAIYAALAWVTALVALQNFQIGAFVDVLGRRLPIWPTYFFVPVGFALGALVMLVRLVNLGLGDNDER